MLFKGARIGENAMAPENHRRWNYEIEWERDGEKASEVSI